LPRYVKQYKCAPERGGFLPRGLELMGDDLAGASGGRADGLGVSRPCANLLRLPYWAAMVWILYMAIEPYVRRRWSAILVAWTRLLSGEFRDPLVARDIHIGRAFGVLEVHEYLWLSSPLAHLSHLH
jgi:hypothetical protein